MADKLREQQLESSITPYLLDLIYLKFGYDYVVCQVYFWIKLTMELVCLGPFCNPIKVTADMWNLTPYLHFLIMILPLKW